MQNKIRVHLQYPWKFPDSSYYKNILDFPPENIDFINYKKSSKEKMEIIGSSKKFEKMRKFKNLIRKIIQIVRLPNLTFTLRRDFDIIHCAHCLTLNRKPFVIDTEVYDRISAAGTARSGIGKYIVRKNLESPYCKKIIAWSEDCKSSFVEAFLNNKKILDKIEIVPFAIPEISFKKIPHKNLRILFVARWFHAKGGIQTLEIFNRLSKKYKNIEFIFICPIPKEYKKKYAKNKQIKILELIPQKKLFKEVYPSCDIFFYPGFGDSYGFTVPEALSFGLPVISSRTFAKSELIEDRKTGFIVDIPKDFFSDLYPNYINMNKKMLNDFYEKTSLLIENKLLLKQMSENARKASLEKFSIKKRNKLLEKIYSESVQ